jgi:hypothetical protein
MINARTDLVWRLSAALLLAFSLLGIGWVPLTYARPASAAPPTPPSDPPVDWWSAAQRDLRLAEYQVTWQQATAPGLPDAYQAPNRASGFRTYFAESGLHLVQRAAPPKLGERPATGPQTAEPAKIDPWGLDITLIGVKDGQVMVDLAQPRLVAAGNRIEYRRGAVIEWYKNDEAGLEQGFTVYGPPGGSEVATAPIAIDLAFAGDLTPTLARDGGIDLLDFTGRRMLRYLKLYVRDATGTRIPAHMELPSAEQLASESLPTAGHTLVRLAVDATGARYPIIVDPTISGLSPAADWSAESGQDASSFGFSVATAGNINGDSYSDVIVGAPWYDNGVDNEGRVFVYLGSAAGLVVTPTWTAESNQLNAFFGFSVGTAGDVNDDGYDDIIVGASDYDNTLMNTLMDEGAVFVWYGSASGLGADGVPGNADWWAFGGQEEAYFGTSVGTAGDVNHDGVSDVIIGAPRYTNGETHEGCAFAFYGPLSGAAGAPSWTGEVDQEEANFGAAVGTAGRVDDDEYDDVIIGAPSYNTDLDLVAEGAAFVFHGSASGLGAAAVWTALGTVDDGSFGASVGTAGDVNNDTYADVIVGAPDSGNAESREGIVFVYHGSSGGLNSSANWTAESDQIDAYFGSSVGTAGDIDGDGYDDVIIGATGYDSIQGTVGRAFVYYGSSGGLSAMADWAADGSQLDAGFGVSVGTAGDVNNDGFADVIAGASGDGWAFVYHGTGLAQPPVVPALTIRRGGNDVGLLWTHNPANRGGYEIWWGTSPYFAPGTSGVFSDTIAAPLSSTTVYTHTGALGDVNTHHMYLVRSINSMGDRSDNSNRVGEFEFRIIPGTP